MASLGRCGRRVPRWVRRGQHLSKAVVRVASSVTERISRTQEVTARIVANACAANPLALVIPCHRVIRADGELVGYRWGLERKRELLEKEASA